MLQTEADTELAKAIFQKLYLFVVHFLYQPNKPSLCLLYQHKIM